ncbi:50S ribosomal protein L24 [Sphaerisporangium krabiense]|uniref:50S ribosomal protein L24 n=1 Tax=Sphaerisporangium krabiense TaxID=763782 RepID=UPI00195146AC|nr:50S ribosomal protein L24 [Sphaerisporangium krabiense]
MHVKKGDLVQVIAGKDKGAKGRVIRALPREDRVVVEGVNLIKKHSKVTHQGPRGAKEGGVQTLEAPIHVSNVKKLKDDAKKDEATKDDKPAKKAAEADESGEDN